MLCYDIPYSHRSGRYVATKFASSPEEALSLVQQSHRGMSVSSTVGAITYETPRPTRPQPFGWDDETAAVPQASEQRAA